MWLLPESEIDRLIFEDAPSGDMTTELLGIGDVPGCLRLAARAPLTLAGIEVAERMLTKLGLRVEIFARSGARLSPGDPVLAATGPAAALHIVWRSSKILIEDLSGIATATRAMVDAAEAVAPDARIALTRKTVPGTRRLSQMAAKAGGGIIHRAGLSETVLIFAEHRSFCPGLSLEDLFARVRAGAPERKIGIEVGTTEEAFAAIDAGFDVIQMEKFPLAEIRKVVARAETQTTAPLIAAAGGISASNVAEIVAAGVGLAVTSWPYTAKPAEFSTELGPV